MGLVSLLLFLVFVLAVVFPLHGQGLVEVKTDFGFNGYFFPNYPTPVRVWVRSYGPAFEGRIVISQELRSPWGGAVEERLILPFRSAGPGRGSSGSTSPSGATSIRLLSLSSPTTSSFITERSRSRSGPWRSGPSWPSAALSP